MHSLVSVASFTQKLVDLVLDHRLQNLTRVFLFSCFAIRFSRAEKDQQLQGSSGQSHMYPQLLQVHLQ